MNIVFVTPEFPYPPNSGGRIYTWQRIKYLSQNNNIYICSMIDDNDKQYLNDKEVKDVFTDIFVYKRKNKIIQAIKGIKYPFSVATRRSEEMFNDISMLTSKNNIDLIIIDHPQMLVNCDMNNNIPKVLTQHNIEFLAFESMYNKNNNMIKKFIYKRECKLMQKYEEYYYKNNIINGYSFISQEDKEYFENKYNNNSTILIPPGLNYIEKEYKKKQGYNIVFTGKMDYEPNIQAMRWFCEEIFPKIQKEILDVKLYIVGKKPTDYIKKLKNENIIVTGEVDSVEEYLKLANVVIVPLLSGGGVKIKLIEALQFRNIVITTSKGVEGTKFTNNNELLISDDVDEFAKYCIDVLKKPEKYKDYIQKSIECIEENYLWSSIGSKYEQFLNEITL